MHVSCKMDPYINVYMHCVYGCGQMHLTLWASCIKVVSDNYNTIGVIVALNQPLTCNWHMALLHIIMPRVCIATITCPLFCNFCYIAL